MNIEVNKKVLKPFNCGIEISHCLKSCMAREMEVSATVLKPLFDHHVHGCHKKSSVRFTGASIKIFEKRRLVDLASS